MIRNLRVVSEKLEGTAENHGKLKLWLRLLTCTIKVPLSGGSHWGRCARQWKGNRRCERVSVLH